MAETVNADNSTQPTIIEIASLPPKERIEVKTTIISATLDDILGTIAKHGAFASSMMAHNLTKGGGFTASDLFILGAGGRVNDLAISFSTMIKSHNLSVAGAILRMQLDTAMRLNIRNLVSNPEYFCVEFLKGVRVDAIKDSAGNALRDVYLRSALSTRFPWIDDPYLITSGYVHFSNKHILEKVTSFDDKSGSFDFTTGERSDRNDHDYVNIVMCFEHITRICMQLMAEWLQSTGRIADFPNMAE